MHITERKLINGLILFALIILIALGFISYTQSRKVQESTSWVVHTHQVINTTNEIQILEMTAEAGLNKIGAVSNDTLNNNLKSLENLTTVKLNYIKTLTKDNQAQNIRITKVAPLIKEKFDYLHKYLENANSKDLTNQINQELNILNETIANNINEINNEELKLLRVRNANFYADLVRTKLQDFYLMIFCAFVLLCAYVYMNRYLSKRYETERMMVDTEEKLRATNSQLAKSEERFNLAVTGAKVGLWDWNVQTNYMYYSPYVKVMLGYADDELPANMDTFFSKIHPEDLNRVKVALKEHFKHNVPYSIEYRLLKKSNVYNWFRIVGQVIFDNNKKPLRMAGVITDIEERKKFLTRLNTQYSILKILGDESSIKNIFKHISKTICSNMDYDFCIAYLKDKQTEHFNCIFEWNDITKANQSCSEGLKAGGPNTLTEKVLRLKSSVWIEDIEADNIHIPDRVKDLEIESGFAFPIVVENKIEAIMEFFTRDTKLFDEDLKKLIDNISMHIGLFIEKKDSENQLHVSESYKNAVLETALDAIITINANGDMISSNKQTKIIFAYDANIFPIKNINVLIPQLTESLSSLTDNQLHEFKAKRANGDFFPLELNVANMAQDDELLYVIVCRDITERRRLEVLKNEFISVVSHELRTPLTSIRGALAVLNSGEIEKYSNTTQKFLDIASHNCDRLLLLINDILDIEKIEAGKMDFNMQRVDINMLINEAIINNKPYADKYNVKINLGNTVENVSVCGDANRLMQVFNNLLSNAAKFSDPNTEIEVSSKILGDMLQIAVTDHGKGIPKQFESRIFQKFSQADSPDTRTRGGSGLGLSISKAIIERHHGTISYTSTEGCGTTFYFSIPLETATIES